MVACVCGVGVVSAEAAKAKSLNTSRYSTFNVPVGTTAKFSTETGGKFPISVVVKEKH